MTFSPSSGSYFLGRAWRPFWTSATILFDPNIAGRVRRLRTRGVLHALVTNITKRSLILVSPNH